MNTRTLEHSSKLVAATSWGAILSGVFVALALQTLLLLLGLAVAGSVGDDVPGGGFALWAVLVAIASFMIGGALAGFIARADDRASGFAAGGLMWAVALVAGNFLSGFIGTARAGDTGWAWWPFFAAVLALGAALIGGAMGAAIRGRRSSSTPTRFDTPSTVGPVG